MDNDLNSWRAAIGTFYARVHPVVLRSISHINILLYIRGLIAEIRNRYRFILKYNRSGILVASNISLMVFLTLLLLLSGDISENPGPDVGHGSLSVLHLNIRSIRNKISYIEDCLTDFDILCFTETHLSNDVDISNLLIKGFRSPFRKDKSAYSGGILVYVADHILSERMANVEIFWDESVWIKVATKHDSYYVCTIYRPPSSDIEFWDLLDRNLEFISEISNNIIVVGDINEDQLNVRNHKLKDIMLVNTMKNVIVSPTRITDTTSTLIDPIMVNQDQHILKCGVLDVPSDISDHKITFAIIPFEINSDVSYTRSVWNFKRADFFKI